MWILLLDNKLKVNSVNPNSDLLDTNTMKIIDNFVLSMLYHNLSIQQRWNKRHFIFIVSVFYLFVKNDIESP